MRKSLPGMGWRWRGSSKEDPPRRLRRLLLLLLLLLLALAAEGEEGRGLQLLLSAEKQDPILRLTALTMLTMHSTLHTPHSTPPID